MKINIGTIIDNSIEWEHADRSIQQSFETYLDKFFNEHKDRNDVPLTFKEWLNIIKFYKEEP